MPHDPEKYSGLVVETFKKNVVCDTDGFYKFWLEKGYMNSEDLRIIADELDKRNFSIKQDLDKYFGENNVPTLPKTVW